MTRKRPDLDGVRSRISDIYKVPNIPDLRDVLNYAEEMEMAIQEVLKNGMELDSGGIAISELRVNGLKSLVGYEDDNG